MPSGTVDHEPSEAAYTAAQTSLQKVIDDAVDLGEVAEEIVHTRTNRRRKAPVIVGHREENGFIEARIEPIGEAVESSPGIVSLHGRSIGRRHGRHRSFLGCPLLGALGGIRRLGSERSSAFDRRGVVGGRVSGGQL